MAASGLLAIGTGWLIAVASWLYFGPKQIFHLWRVTGTKRVGLVVAIYLFAFLYQIFVFGWIVPVGIGLYKIMKKIAI